MHLVPAVKRIPTLRCTIHRGYVSATRDTRVPIRLADISFTGLFALAVCIRNKPPSARDASRGEFNARISRTTFIQRRHARVCDRLVGVSHGLVCDSRVDRREANKRRSSWNRRHVAYVYARSRESCKKLRVHFVSQLRFQERTASRRGKPSESARRADRARRGTRNDKTSSPR